MASKQPKDPEHTFETAIERLERIVEEMESDKLPLEDLLTRYEEGTQLVKVCQEKLDSAERRIEIITRNAAGKPQLNEFEPTTTPSAAPAAVAPTSTVPAAKQTAKPARTESDEVSLF